MFRLTSNEWSEISLSQSVMSSKLKSKQNLTSQNVIPSWGGRRIIPYAFTEHGVAMLSSVLKSDKARTMNIAIIRAFIAIRKIALQKNELTDLFQKLKVRIDEHDIQLTNIYDSIENLLEEKSNSKSWEERERIGFKK